MTNNCKKKICVFLLLLFCLQGSIFCTNVTNVKQEMMQFFCSTLKANYGKADATAILTMLEGLRHYNFHYIIEVDRKKLQKINH